jgi:hypothetical protein
LKVVALFSMGKDSLVMMDKLLQDKNVIIYPVYLFYARLNYLSERLNFYENYFSIKINKFEHYENYKAKKNNVFGSNILTWQENYKYSKDCMLWLLSFFNADKIAYGYKKTDSLIRRGIINGRKKNNSLNYMIHPIADMNDKDIWYYIKKKRIPYPDEYNQGYVHEFSNFMTKSALTWLINNYPNDLENLKQDFPFIESLLYL